MLFDPQFIEFENTTASKNAIKQKLFTDYVHALLTDKYRDYIADDKGQVNNPKGLSVIIERDGSYGKKEKDNDTSVKPDLYIELKGHAAVILFCDYDAVSSAKTDTFLKNEVIHGRWNAIQVTCIIPAQLTPK